MPETAAAFLAAGIFAVIHLLVDRLPALDVLPRSRWLSFSGGAAVAYIFLHIFPELARAHGRYSDSLPWMDMYLVSLAGLVVFYGLERHIKLKREEADRIGGPFWLHIGSFTAYNLLIGFLLLHREEATGTGLVLYTVAIGLHFLTTDYGLWQHHRRLYSRYAKWILAAGVIGGVVLGAAMTVPEPYLQMLFAFLAGSIILNVMKEELPEERLSRFSAFLSGAVVYSLLQLASENIDGIQG